MEISPNCPDHNGAAALSVKTCQMRLENRQPFVYNPRGEQDFRNKYTPIFESYSDGFHGAEHPLLQYVLGFEALVKHLLNVFLDISMIAFDHQLLSGFEISMGRRGLWF